MAYFCPPLYNCLSSLKGLSQLKLRIPNSHYPIVETFHSVQGEGAWTGVNAFFIRLGGCDVHCPWCDTKESWNPQHHPQRHVQDLTTAAKNANPAIIVVTGGEPLMHDLAVLTESLQQTGIPVHLETSGSHPFSGNFNWVTFSPKPFKLPHPSIYDRVDELKVVVGNPQDLDFAVTQSQKVRPSALKYLQAEWNTPSSQDLIFNYVLAHPEWRISVQTHKHLNVR